MNPAERLQPGPVERHLVLKESVFEKLLSLKDHRNAWCRKHHRGTQRGSLSREPAVGMPRPDLFGNSAFAVRYFIMGLGIDHPLYGIAVISMTECIAGSRHIPIGIVAVLLHHHCQ